MPNRIDHTDGAYPTLVLADEHVMALRTDQVPEPTRVNDIRGGGLLPIVRLPFGESTAQCRCHGDNGIEIRWDCATDSHQPSLTKRTARYPFDMASSDKPDFDPLTLLAAPMQLVGLALTAVETARQTMTTVVETANSLQRSAVALEELITRVTSMVDTIEAPARALAPEMERLGRRMNDIGELLDGPMQTLIPGLQKMASMMGFGAVATPSATAVATKATPRKRS